LQNNFILFAKTFRVLDCRISMKRNRINRASIIIVLLLFINSCSNENTLIDSVTDNEVLLIINDQNITAKIFKKVFEKQKKIFRIQDVKNLKAEELIWIKNRVIDKIVKNSLLSQEIEKNNINVKEDILNRALKEAREGYPDGVFAKTLELENISIDDWEEAIKNNLLTNQLIEQQVNSKVHLGDKALLNYFDENVKKFYKKEQVKALHIMVETEDEIRQVQKELQRKQKTFSKLAQEFSLGPEAVKGGDLGYFEAGQMPEEFDDVFKIKTGSVSDIIKTPYGFHLFKVVDKIKERQMGFDESKPMIEKILLQDLQDKAFRDWFFKLKKNSKIEVNYELLQKIY